MKVESNGELLGEVEGPHAIVCRGIIGLKVPWIATP